MQDIPVLESSTARTLFDNGSELTLVSSFFAKKNNLPYEEATYTLAGVGGAVKTYHAGKGGRIYTVPLMSSSGEQINVKALSVEVILPGKKGREKLNLDPKKFPHVPVSNLKKAEKCLPRKHLDLLIGNSDLGLQPACTWLLQGQQSQGQHSQVCGSHSTGPATGTNVPSGGIKEEN